MAVHVKLSIKTYEGGYDIRALTFDNHKLLDDYLKSFHSDHTNGKIIGVFEENSNN